MHIAKALALNASLASVSQPALQAAVKSVRETENLLWLMIEELKTVMFLVGAQKITQLAKTPIVIDGKTSKWVRARGFNIENYARRGVH